MPGCHGILYFADFKGLVRTGPLIGLHGLGCGQELRMHERRGMFDWLCLLFMHCNKSTRCSS